MIWKKSNPYLNKQDNISTRYDYKNNQYVKSVEVFWKGYDPYTDSEMTEVQVVSCDESVFRWESKTISSYGNGLWIDRFGKYIFGCSLRGIYCLDVKTGQAEGYFHFLFTIHSSLFTFYLSVTAPATA